MLKPIPFANAMTITTILFYFVLWGLWLAAPSLFRVVYNAQFFGANVAALFPRTYNLGAALVTLVIVSISVWLMGYVWATLYNRLAKAR